MKSSEKKKLQLEVINMLLANWTKEQIDNYNYTYPNSLGYSLNINQIKIKLLNFYKKILGHDLYDLLLEYMIKTKIEEKNEIKLKIMNKTI